MSSTLSQSITAKSGLSSEALLNGMSGRMVFQRARAFPGLSKGAHRYSHLAVAAMEREGRDLPKSLQNYMKFVVELH